MLYGEIEQIQNSSNISEIPVASTDVIYSRAFLIKGDSAWGLSAIATSDGTVDVLIELEESPVTPSTEGSADGNYVEPEGLNDILNLGDELMHIKQVNPVPMKFARFRLTGQGSNHASTTVNLKLFKQGEF